MKVAGTGSGIFSFAKSSSTTVDSTSSPVSAATAQSVVSFVPTFPAVAEKSYKPADFERSSDRSASGTLVIQLDPVDVVSDVKKTKKYLINASAEICRALKISTSAVTL